MIAKTLSLGCTVIMVDEDGMIGSSIDQFTWYPFRTISSGGKEKHHQHIHIGLNRRVVHDYYFELNN